MELVVLWNEFIFIGSNRSKIDKILLFDSPSVTRWCRLTLIKVNVFVRRLLLNKIPTRYNLSSRGLEINLIYALSTRKKWTMFVIFSLDVIWSLIYCIFFVDGGIYQHLLSFLSKLD